MFSDLCYVISDAFKRCGFCNESFLILLPALKLLIQSLQCDSTFFSFLSLGFLKAALSDSKCYGLITITIIEVKTSLDAQSKNVVAIELY